MTITPSLVSRLPAMRIKRKATSFGKDVECRASKRSCTADETLLTFCPPGPEARTNDSESSDSSMEMVSVIRIIPTSRHQILFRKHLAFFHRRLVKRVDSQKMRGDDCLQHEMHHNSPRAAARNGEPASCAKVWPPRLDPPVPRITMSVARSAD